jgi:hypothetical protein
MTPRRPPDLDPKGRGDKRMVGKRGPEADGYAGALQRLNDMAKAGLPEPQCSVVGLTLVGSPSAYPTSREATASSFVRGTPCPVDDAL